MHIRTLFGVTYFLRCPPFRLYASKTTCLFNVEVDINYSMCWFRIIEFYPHLNLGRPVAKIQAHNRTGAQGAGGAQGVRAHNFRQRGSHRPGDGGEQASGMGQGPRRNSQTTQEAPAPRQIVESRRTADGQQSRTDTPTGLRGSYRHSPAAHGGERVELLHQQLPCPLQVSIVGHHAALGPVENDVVPGVLVYKTR